jgi:hypothetical protein
VGLSARTHDNGALLERWRAQCGISTATISQLADSRIETAGIIETASIA